MGQEERDKFAGRFLNSEDPAPKGPKFEALGHAGSDHYVGLETFDNPGCYSVNYNSDELIAFCPITKQVDHYKMRLTLLRPDKCIESKSLKLWLQQFNNEENGLFAEALAVYIRDCVGVVCFPETARNVDEDVTERVQVLLIQKSRGGISIEAIA